LNQKINEVVETPGGAGMPKLKIASFATGKDSSIVSGATHIGRRFQFA